MTSTTDRRRGAQVFSVSGDEVEARSNRFWAQRKLEGGERQRYERISVERLPFDPEGLSDEWEVLLEGDDGWSALENVALAEDETGWEADLCPLAAQESP